MTSYNSPRSAVDVIEAAACSLGRDDESIDDVIATCPQPHADVDIRCSPSTLLRRCTSSNDVLAVDACRQQRSDSVASVTSSTSRRSGSTKSDSGIGSSSRTSTLFNDGTVITGTCTDDTTKDVESQRRCRKSVACGAVVATTTTEEPQNVEFDGPSSCSTLPLTRKSKFQTTVRRRPRDKRRGKTETGPSTAPLEACTSSSSRSLDGVGLLPTAPPSETAAVVGGGASCVRRRDSLLNRDGVGSELDRRQSVADDADDQLLRGVRVYPRYGGGGGSDDSSVTDDASSDGLASTASPSLNDVGDTDELLMTSPRITTTPVVVVKVGMLIIHTAHTI